VTVGYDLTRRGKPLVPAWTTADDILNKAKRQKT
jgi:hypothetical protein